MKAICNKWYNCSSVTFKLGNETLCHQICMFNELTPYTEQFCWGLAIYFLFIGIFNYIQDLFLYSLTLKNTTKIKQAAFLSLLFKPQVLDLIFISYTEIAILFQYAEL